jgi:hypothetical protein
MRTPNSFMMKTVLATVSLLISLHSLADSPIEGITGRLVDAFQGHPLTDESHFAEVHLYRANRLFQPIASQYDVEKDGGFSFIVDDDGKPIEAGTYRIFADAQGYQRKRSKLLNVAAGDSLDIGELGLVPPAVTFEGVDTCDNIPPEGGECTVSVRLVSHRPLDVSIEPWAIMRSGSGLSPPFGAHGSYNIVFELRLLGNSTINLPAFGSRVVEFWFAVPAARGHDVFFDIYAYVAKAGTFKMRTFNSRLVASGSSVGEEYRVGLRRD